MRALDIASTGMMAQQTNVEVISNNIANMNTNAYNGRRAQFSDLLYQNVRRVGSTSSDIGTIVPTGIQLGLGVRTSSVYRLTTQGSLQNTNNTLDLAVQGKGYFKVLLPNGDYAYTRDGAFQLSDTGKIVTQDGYTVMPSITIDTQATGITVNSSGQPSDATPGAVGYGTILQGYLETSNVNVVSEITNLISAQRAYEMNSKVVQASDQMLSTINQMK